MKCDCLIDFSKSDTRGTIGEALDDAAVILCVTHQVIVDRAVEESHVLRPILRDALDKCDA